MNDIILYTVAFLVGSVIGSFLNVCIYRIPRNISIMLPSSRCPSCNTSIYFYDNIPIISYILLGGRCRYCKEKILLRYPFIEFLNGALYISVLWRFGSPFSWFLLVYFAFLSSLIVITFIDLEYQIIPDGITIPGIILALIFGSTTLPDPFNRSDLLGFKASIIGALLGGGLYYVIAILGKAVFKKDVMGGGDIKLMVMVGGILGWKGVLLTTFIGSLFGSLIGISLIVIKGKEWGIKIPFGPYLSLGAFISLLLGEEILRWYLAG